MFGMSPSKAYVVGLFSTLFLDCMLCYMSAGRALIIIFISLCEHTVTAMEPRTLLDPLSWAGDCLAPAQSDTKIDNCSDTSLFLLSLCFTCEFCICAREVLKLKNHHATCRPQIIRISLTKIHKTPRCT